MPTERDIIEQCACTRVRVAARAVTRHYDDALRPSGLRATQFAVLVAIALDGAISITALSTLLGMDRTTLTRNLRPLERERLVEIGPEGWRRSRTLAITRKGQAAIEKATPLWTKAQQALKRKLGDGDWIAVQGGLDRLIAAA